MILLICAAQKAAAQKTVYECDSPKVKVVLPQSSGDGRAVVICPGGGYGHAGKPKEAGDWIPFFNSQGIAVATLMYDLPEGDKDRPLGQVRDVFRLLNEKHEEWNINPDCIGIMGSSAGGHLATAYASHETGDLKPAFQILFYPVISLYTKRHQGMAKKFLGSNDKTLEEEWSADLKADDSCPPTVMILADDDKIIDPMNSVNYYAALKKHNVPCSMMIYPDGGHGFGFSSSFPYHDQMTKDLKGWLTTILPQKAEVYLTAGQSNTDGRVMNTNLPEEIKTNRYKYCKWSFGSGLMSGRGIFKEYYPQINNSNNPNRWGYDAVVYYKLDQEARQPFFVIKESLGGTAIDTLCKSSRDMYWMADEGWLSRTKAADKGGSSLLKAFTENIGACIDNQLSHLPAGYDIKVMMWHQGESDSGQGKKYYGNLKKVVKYVRDYLVEKTGDKKYSELPFVCGTVPHKSKRYNADVEKAMYKLQKEDKNFYVVDASDLSLLPDQLHFDAEGAKILGERMYEVVRKLK